MSPCAIGDLTAEDEAQLRELAFDRMIERSLADVDAGRVLSHEELVREILTWFGAKKDAP